MTPQVSTAIVPFAFDGDTLDVVSEGGRVLVGLVRACAVLGIDPDTQRKKLNRHVWGRTVIMTVQLPGDSQARETAFLDLDAFPMWLATINPGKVRPDLRAKLVRYQCEAARVLRDHFLGGGRSVSTQLAALRSRVERLEASEPRPRLAPRGRGATARSSSSAASSALMRVLAVFKAYHPHCGEGRKTSEIIEKVWSDEPDHPSFVEARETFTAAWLLPRGKRPAAKVISTRFRALCGLVLRGCDVWPSDDESGLRQGEWRIFMTVDRNKSPRY